MESQLPTLPLRQTENTLRQVVNDTRTVAEARCVEHGIGEGTTANSAAVLLPLIATEMIAGRTRVAGESKEASIRRVFKELADFTGYDRYTKVGYALFVLARHGLAHGFYPNDGQLANGPKVVVGLHFWLDERQRSFCIDKMGPRADSKHLTRKELTGGKTTVLEASAQWLAKDVASYVEAFLDRLTSGTTLHQLVTENSDDQARRNAERVSDALDAGDWINLGV